MVIGGAPTNMIQQKKKKQQLVTPQINKAVNPPIVDVATEAANLARQNVLPDSSMSPEIANQLRAIYAGQANQNVANPQPIPMSAEQQAQNEQLIAQIGQVPKQEQDKQNIEAGKPFIVDELGNKKFFPAGTVLPDNLSPQQKQDMILAGAGGFSTAALAGSAVVGGAIAAAPLLPSIVTSVGANALKAKGLLKLGGLSLTGGAVLGKVTLGKHQFVTEANDLFTSSTDNIGQIINAAKAGEDRVEVIKRYNEELQNIRDAKRALRQITSNSISAFLSGGKDELVKLEAYERNLPFIQNELMRALGLIGNEAAQ